MMVPLTPHQIVGELDKHIVGQQGAKRAVAVALRNRYRRSQLSADLQHEVSPKNILMIGPTGVGKTEIARRLARLVGAPFVKVEATKFTEVGYVGRDVDAMVRDLAETAVRMVKAERIEAVRDKAQAAVTERLLDALAPRPARETRMRNPLEAIFGMAGPPPQPENPEGVAELDARRSDLRRRLAAGELEDQVVEIELEEQSSPMLGMFAGPGMEELGQNFQEFLGGLLPKQRRRRRVTVAEARRLLTTDEAARLVDMDQVTAEAVALAENQGIIFIDEIDKIAGKERGSGPDVSREGVQRDILPIVEGATVVTKYGPVQTQHVLFIAAGAFHVAKPADLIPELQGRLPIRVELTPLAEADFIRILTEPENALTRQYSALLAADGVTVEFTPGGIAEIARVAAQINTETEDIGARRLYTIMEKVLEDLSFAAPDRAPAAVTINEGYVQERLAGILAERDLSRFIL